jgi:hypothetical protein
MVVVGLAQLRRGQPHEHRAAIVRRCVCVQKANTKHAKQIENRRVSVSVLVQSLAAKASPARNEPIIEENEAKRSKSQQDSACFDVVFSVLSLRSSSRLSNNLKKKADSDAPPAAAPPLAALATADAVAAAAADAEP